MSRVHLFLSGNPDMDKFGLMLLWGSTYDEIAEEFGISARLARMVKRHFNLPVKAAVKSLTPAQQRNKAKYEVRIARRTTRDSKKKDMREQILALMESGLSYSETAALLKVKTSYVQYLAAFTDDEKELLMSRARHKCEDCGRGDVKLHAHHVSYTHGIGQILCIPCHITANTAQGRHPGRPATRSQEARR